MNRCFVRICLRADCPEYAPIDIKMGIINRVSLFRCNLIVARCGGVNRVCTAHSGKPDFTRPYAVRRTHGAHARERAGVGGVAQLCPVKRRA